MDCCLALESFEFLIYSIHQSLRDALFANVVSYPAFLFCILSTFFCWTDFFFACLLDEMFVIVIFLLVHLKS